MSIYRFIDQSGKVHYCSAVRAYRHTHGTPEPGMRLEWFDESKVRYVNGEYTGGVWREYTEPAIHRQSGPLMAAAPHFDYVYINAGKEIPR